MLKNIATKMEDFVAKLCPDTPLPPAEYPGPSGSCNGLGDLHTSHSKVELWEYFLQKEPIFSHE